jgi:predicted Rossmann fold flavoprotein
MVISAMQYDLIIIGAGTAAGFLLAFLGEGKAAHQRKILVLEKTREPFRKVYGSGNGRCNFSNTVITRDAYYSIAGSDAWQKSAFEAVVQLDLKQFFFTRGIPSYADAFGRLMPYTNTAKTIGQYFERQASRSSVELKNYAEAVAVEKNAAGFTVRYTQAKQPASASAPAVVYACGGSAYPSLGTDGSGFALLRALGHRIVPPAAAIVPLETAEAAFHALAGLKMECAISGGGYARKGELLFTKYGISGPNVLFASTAISLALMQGPVKIVVDFLPETYFTLDYFRALYAAAPEKTATAVFGGSLNDAFIAAFLRQHDLADRISLDGLKNLYSLLKEVEITVKKTRPLAEAQVSLGGVSVDEIDPSSFESRFHKNLFIMGEALDYTGGCGGYNIHWCAATARGVANRLGETGWI